MLPRGGAWIGRTEYFPDLPPNLALSSCRLRLVDGPVACSEPGACRACLGDRCIAAVGAAIGGIPSEAPRCAVWQLGERRAPAWVLRGAALASFPRARLHGPGHHGGHRALLRCCARLREEESTEVRAEGNLGSWRREAGAEHCSRSHCWDAACLRDPSRATQHQRDNAELPTRSLTRRRADPARHKEGHLVSRCSR